MPPLFRLPTGTFSRYRNFNLDTNANKMDIPEELPQRPEKFNTIGKEINIQLNTYPVLSFPKKKVYQYDVSFSGAF